MRAKCKPCAACHACLVRPPAGVILTANTPDLYVVEWSPEQKCFHLQTLQEALARNQSAFLDDRATSYHPLGLFHSRREARAACRVLQEVRDAREPVQPMKGVEHDEDEY